jgi:hypothetical protein
MDMTSPSVGSVEGGDVGPGEALWSASPIAQRNERTIICGLFEIYASLRSFLDMLEHEPHQVPRSKINKSGLPHTISSSDLRVRTKTHKILDPRFRTPTFILP